MVELRATAFIGCSGWEYKHWKGDFYPAGIPRSEWFAHYARHFDTVEINNSFYRLPEPSTVDGWRKQAPPGFHYGWKASRYLTHMRKLKDPADPVDLMFSRARRLGDRLAVVLYQLPPRWKRNVERLQTLLDTIPRDIPQAVEFRDPSWYHDDVFQALQRAGVALCVHDMHGSATPRARVGPFTYVRFHGWEAKYSGNYSDDQLRSWADWLARDIETRRDVYAYFNNDAHGHAPRNAATLRLLLHEALKPIASAADRARDSPGEPSRRRHPARA